MEYYLEMTLIYGNAVTWLKVRHCIADGEAARDSDNISIVIENGRAFPNRARRCGA